MGKQRGYYLKNPEQAAVLLRTATGVVAEDAEVIGDDNANWIENHGHWPTCRLYVYVNFDVGTPTAALSLGMLARNRGTGQYGQLLWPDAAAGTQRPFRASALTPGWWVVDVPADGDDLAPFVAAVANDPYSLAMQVWYSWRP